jgi:hypothetical protein
LRATDQAVHQAVRVTPLSVSSDRIAVVAFRCAALLDRFGEVDRSGFSGRVCEVYPGAALRRWFGDEARGYRRDEAKRAVLVAKLRRASALRLRRIRDLESDDHAFDALVAAVVAAAALRGETLCPVDRALAAEEGWIHLPAGLAPPRL